MTLGHLPAESASYGINRGTVRFQRRRLLPWVGKSEFLAMVKSVRMVQGSLILLPKVVKKFVKGAV